MAYVIKMPKPGLEMKSGKLLAWLVSEGDEVTEDNLITGIESEKTAVEIDAREDDVLRRVVPAEGESTAPGGTLAIVTGADEDTFGLETDAGVGESGSEPVAADSFTGGSFLAEVIKTTETMMTSGGDVSSVVRSRSRGLGRASKNGEVCVSPRAKRLVDDPGVGLTIAEDTGPQGVITKSDVEAAAESATATAAGKYVFAPPSAHRLARKLDVDIEIVEGAGQNGRITESDMRVAGGATTVATDPSVIGATMIVAIDATAANEPAEVERLLSRTHRTTADRLDESCHKAAHVMIDRRTNVEELLAATNAAVDALDVDVLITDVLLLTFLASFDEHPEFDATFEGGVHKLHGEHNTYTVVNVDEGLIAPVVHNMVLLSLSKPAETRAETAQRAPSGGFTMDDLLGGTFTVSNLSALSVESFDPVINPPQVVILGINTIRRETVPTDDGGVAARRAILFLLSFDHRIVNGADAACMLGTLAEHAENPQPLAIIADG